MTEDPRPGDGGEAREGDVVTEDEWAEIAGYARELVSRLQAVGATVAVAESLTGGLLTSALVDVPGASTVLRGGIVAYATDLKASLLDVDAAMLGEVGPVSPDVALAMARGVRDRLGAQIGLATTGVAGPDPQGGVPPGVVHLALVGAGHDRGAVLQVGGDRAAVRRSSVRAALELAVDALPAP
jgi:nicotinamide-nucleotide amidase